MAVETILIALAVLVALAAGWAFTHRRGTNDELVGMFGLPPDYRVLGTDLGGSKEQLTLRADGLIGKPDSAFHSSRRNHWVAGEYKSRKYYGKIRQRELYQVTMYVGMMRSLYRTENVYGIIRFADKAVRVPFDPVLYARLCELAPELRQAEKSWRPPNPTPLAKR